MLVSYHNAVDCKNWLSSHFRIKSQQDIIELQRIKLQRQQRVIAEMKLSKLLEDTDDSKSRSKDQLKFMAKNGCHNSRSKARCLQIANDLKDEDDDEAQKLLAKGLSAPKFLIEMQARALERELRHQKAQERRVTLDREREALRVAAEEEKVRLENSEFVESDKVWLCYPEFVNKLS